MLSVVIPVFNNADVLDAQLEAVTGQGLDAPWEVVVADNGSTDGSADVARRWAETDERVRVVDASARRGPGAARNIGVVHARGDTLAFCDGDDIVRQGWLAALYLALDKSDVAVGFLDFTTLNGRPATPPTDPWPRQFAYLPAGLGANMAVSRAAFDAVGGFDENLLVGEDIDLCWRLQLRGHVLRRVPDAVVSKRGRRTNKGIVRQSLGYGRSDALLFRRFRPHGMPRQLGLTARSWGWLAVNAGLLADPARRSEWVRPFFIRFGRLVGCVEQQVLYP